jgi:hypothetical protein
LSTVVVRENQKTDSVALSVELNLPVTAKSIGPIYASLRNGGSQAEATDYLLLRRTDDKGRKKTQDVRRKTFSFDRCFFGYASSQRWD